VRGLGLGIQISISAIAESGLGLAACTSESSGRELRVPCGKPGVPSYWSGRRGFCVVVRRTRMISRF
jgi:hypothetical protein